MMKPKYSNDQKVVVEVREPSGWNADVLRVLQGKVGAVGVVKTEHHNGKESVQLDAPRYLVMFDTPTERTSRGVTHSAFWFDEDEIREAP